MDCPVTARQVQDDPLDQPMQGLPHIAEALLGQVRRQRLPQFRQ
jgi:hypothetical protein